MLTRNRRQWLPQAIRNFQQQTYPNKELLILADGEDVRNLVPDDDRIRLIHIEEGRNIGDKRNFGCSQARGEIIVHFDDDDWSAPGRLADQVDRLQTSQKAVTGYFSMLFTDGRAWWRWSYEDNAQISAVGTSLCYRKSWWQEYPFMAKQIGEDGDFVTVAQHHQQIVCVDAGELMVATVHVGNTSPRQLQQDAYRKLPEFSAEPLVSAGFAYHPDFQN